MPHFTGITPARALNENEVAESFDFRTFYPQRLGNGVRRVLGYYNLLLVPNRKSHTSFSLVQILMTLNYRDDDRP